MRIDVLFGAQLATSSEMTGKVVAVIDVLRASTTVAVALAHGARTLIPFDSAEEAISRSKSFERSDARLAGERKMVMIPGFDFGNSPLEFTREAVEGKTILFTTTNGTLALTSVQGARDVVVASYVNFSVVSAMLRTALRGGADVVIICAGRERQFSLEDAACAGRFVRHIMRRLPATELNDAALASTLIDKRYGDNIARLFEDTAHGKALVAAGFGQDLVACAAVDSYPVIPIYQDRQITKLGPERER